MAHPSACHLRGLRLALSVALASALAGAGTAAAAEPQTVPAGATTQVAVPESNIVATCTPPGTFHPNPTTWHINPSTVKLGGAGGEMPVAGSLVSVEVPANHSPYQSITISWSGNTDCVSYNGSITLNVSPATTTPTTTEAPKKAKPKRARKTSAKAFALAGVALADRYLDLVGAFRRAPKNEARGNAVWRRAVLAAVTWDLAKFSKPRTWRLEPSKLGVDLRKGQLEALPAFARDLKKISEYEKVMLDMTNRKYAVDADFRGNVDALAALDTPGKTTYESLDAEGKLRVASQVQGLSGSLQVLLQMARNAGKSAAGVVFGR